MEIRAGSRLKSSVCQTEVIAVKAPGTEMDIRCGGVPMVDPTGSIPDDPSPGCSYERNPNGKAICRCG